MSIVAKPDALFCIAARNKFGRRSEYAVGMFGNVMFGDEYRWLTQRPFGASNIGHVQFGDMVVLSGVYAQRHLTDGRGTIKMKMYVPKNPRYVPQQANRNKFAAAVAAWQSLTPEQKQVYNRQVAGKHMSGYNKMIKEYMSS